MATKASAKEKFVNNVTSELAVTKMTSKLSTYLGITVDKDAGPVKQWRDTVQKAAGDLFDRAYENMKAAYK